MPLIPGVNTPEVKATAANTPYFKIDTTVDEFGSGIGKSMLALGKSFGDAAAVAAKFIPKKPTEITDDGSGFVLPMPIFDTDASAGVEITNQFNEAAQQIQSDYLGLQAGDAVLAQGGVAQKLDALKDQVLATAPTPAAARVAQPAIEGWTAAIKDVVQRHALAQQRPYDDNLDLTQVALGRNSVGSLYNNEPTFLTNLHVAARANVDVALRDLMASNPQAGPAEIAAVTKVAKLKTASDFAYARIEGAIEQNDLGTALSLHQRWSVDLQPDDQAAVTQHLQTALYQNQLQQATQRVMAIRQPMPGETPLTSAS